MSSVSPGRKNISINSPLIDKIEINKKEKLEELEFSI